MFIALLFILIAGGAIHGIVTKRPDRIAEFVLLYVLVGYCALPLGFIALRAVIAPEIMIRNLGLATEPALVQVLGSLIAALAILALLSLRFRGAFLLAPVIGWSAFWASANYMHVALLAEHGTPSAHGYALRTFVAHGLVSFVLLAAFAIYWTKGARREATAS